MSSVGNPLTFLHLSDIHFGQERGGSVYVHEDVRERLVSDVQRFFTVRQQEGRTGATAIIITGDIAYGGKKAQYDQASEFLDRLAVASRCKDNTRVLVAPGNHDVDLDETTHGLNCILKTIQENGEAELDRHLESEKDRIRFYDRLKDYGVFAEGYGCALDAEGGNAGEHDFALAPGRVLKFVAWNSALLCGRGNSRGKLLLGAKQRRLRLEDGVERVVLSHHPLPWFADEADAKKFLKNRARMLLSGHEHTAEIVVEQVDTEAHFVHIAAGATIPPDGYDYTYNIIDFAWSEPRDGMDVTIHPRVWVDSSKSFDADYNRLGGAASKRCELGCPQFRAGPPKPSGLPARDENHSSDSLPQREDASSAIMGASMSDDAEFGAARLRFFRELRRVQRLGVLIKLGALPRTLDGLPAMSVERKALEKIRKAGRLRELHTAIEAELALDTGPASSLITPLPEPTE